jgi:hypothetical protein
VKISETGPLKRGKDNPPFNSLTNSDLYQKPIKSRPDLTMICI